MAPSRMSAMPITVRHLGTTPYLETLARMRDFTRERAAAPGTAGPIGDELWLTEHPPVFTMGFASRPEHLLATGDIPVVVAMAGPIASGKSTVALGVAAELGGVVISVRQALLEILNLTDPTRATLQREGADLDRRTVGRWLSDYLTSSAEQTDCALVVDSLRTLRQTEPVLAHVPGAILVYLDASESVRRRRYIQSALTDPMKKRVSFGEAMDHPTERLAYRLASIADITIETDDQTSEETTAEVVQTVRARASH